MLVHLHVVGGQVADGDGGWPPGMPIHDFSYLWEAGGPLRRRLRVDQRPVFLEATFTHFLSI